MAYTRVWDEAKPTGGEESHDIDLIFRQLKQDLRERMNSLVDDWTADPVALKPLHGTQFIHHSMFTADEVDAISLYTSTDAYMENADAAQRTYRTGLTLPPGTTITALSMLANRNSGVGNNLTFRFKTIAYGSPATVTTLETLVTNANNLAVWPFTATSLPVTLVADTMYVLEVVFVGGTGGRLYGAKVTY